MRVRSVGGARVWTPLPFIFLCAACISTPQGPAENAVQLAALLPFTGAASSVGTDIERSLILAAERLTEAGGLNGRPLHVVARDTGLPDASDRTRELLSETESQVVIGPTDQALLEQLDPALEIADVVVVSGAVTTFAARAAGAASVHTAPDPVIPAAQLARRMVTDGVADALIVRGDDAYGARFEEAARTELEALGATVSGVATVGATADIGPALALVAQANPEAILVATFPRLGAEVITAITATGASPRWFLAPTLRTRELVDGVPPGALEGALGIAPSVVGDLAGFSSTFTNRWDASSPVPETFFFYDALVLWALAYESAVRTEGLRPTADFIRQRMIEIAGPPGTSVTWNELDRALEGARAGEDLDYCGASGRVDLDVNGTLLEPLAEFWTVTNGRVVQEQSFAAGSLCRR